jgi:hypothetical protein
MGCQHVCIVGDADVRTQQHVTKCVYTCMCAVGQQTHGDSSICMSEVYYIHACSCVLMSSNVHAPALQGWQRELHAGRKLTVLGCLLLMLHAAGYSVCYTLSCPLSAAAYVALRHHPGPAHRAIASQHPMDDHLFTRSDVIPLTQHCATVPVCVTLSALP